MAASYQRILVPMDGSELAAQALAPARVLAEQFDAALILMRVVSSVEQVLELSRGVPQGQSREAQQNQLIETAAASLEVLCEDLKIHGIRAHSVIGVGDAADQIVDYVTQNEVDLVVMSTHGRTGLTRWAFGSVARKVMDAVRCSVLLVRQKKAAT